MSALGSRKLMPPIQGLQKRDPDEGIGKSGS